MLTSLPLIRKAVLSTSVLASGGTGSVATYLLTKKEDTPEQVQRYTILEKDVTRLTEKVSTNSRIAAGRLAYIEKLQERQKCFDQKVKEANDKNYWSWFTYYPPELDACGESPQDKPD